MGEGLDKIVASHQKEFDGEPAVVVRVPAPYTLMGAFSDYCKGRCITATGVQGLLLSVSRRDDQMVRMFNATLNDRKRCSLTNIKFRKEDRWGNYIKGVISELYGEGMHVGGMNITIDGELLHCENSVLCSALSVATAMAINELFHLKLDQSALLRIAFLACTSFNNEMCRISDMLTMLRGEDGKLMIFDLQHVSYSLFEYPFPADGKVIGLVVESRIPPHAMREELASRRVATKDAFDKLRRQYPIGSLRDYPEQELKERSIPMDEDSRHILSYVLSESKLVMDGYNQLAQKDAVLYGKTMNRVQGGLRDLMEISCPEVDWLTKRASEIPGCLGSGMIATGLSGTVFVLLRDTALPLYLNRLEEYEHIFGFRPRWSVFKPQSKAKIMPLHHEDPADK